MTTSPKLSRKEAAMARKLDQIIVIDVESTCWEGKPPTGEESDIIEIGLCIVDLASSERVAKECILVRPERSTVSPFCTQLTTLTQDQVDEGIPFGDACAALRKTYSSKERTWASYGDYDRRQFERQCREWNVSYPFGPTHINVKNLVAIARGLSHEVGMGRALELLDIPLEGTHHRAVDDAWNIAGIFSALLKMMRTT